MISSSEKEVGGTAVYISSKLSTFDIDLNEDPCAGHRGTTSSDDLFCGMQLRSTGWRVIYVYSGAISCPCVETVDDETESNITRHSSRSSTVPPSNPRAHRMVPSNLRASP